ncbi:MAG: phage holin family protein [Bacteroidota bacterium]
MESKTNVLEPLIENVQAYGKTSIELYKLKAIEKASDVSSTVISRTVAFSVLALFVFMVSFGVAFWLGDMMGKTYYGFLCVGGFYGIVWAVLYFFLHNWMKERTNNSIITQMLN